MLSLVYPSPSFAGTVVQGVEKAMGLFEKRASLKGLLISPVHSVGSSSMRSPKTNDERFELKVRVIDYYCLWASAEDASKPPNERVVLTMLPRAKKVAFKDAILAHIWPSSKAREADEIRRLLSLPLEFHLNVRNFLILEKHVEVAFDAHKLLFFPQRGSDGSPPTALARSFQLESYRVNESAVDRDCARAAVQALHDVQLYLPSVQHVPFMRLLAWNSISAIREHDETIPAALHLDASMSSDARGAALDGFSELASCGLIYFGR